MNTLKYVRPGNGFVPKVNMFQKRDVNGKTESKLFNLLKDYCPSPSDIISKDNNVLWSPIRTTDIRWNFEKFLIDHNGVPLRRYSPQTKPNMIYKDIKALLKKCEASQKLKSISRDSLDSLSRYTEDRYSM